MRRAGLAKASAVKLRNLCNPNERQCTVLARLTRRTLRSNGCALRRPSEIYGRDRCLVIGATVAESSCLRQPIQGETHGIKTEENDVGEECCICDCWMATGCWVRRPRR